MLMHWTHLYFAPKFDNVKMVQYTHKRNNMQKHSKNALDYITNCILCTEKCILCLKGAQSLL